MQAERNTFNSRLLEREREVSQVTAELEGELTAARKSLGGMKGELILAEQAFQAQRAKLLDECEAERAEMQKANDALNRDVEQHTAALTEAKISKVEAVAKAGQQVSRLEDTLTVAKERIKELESELADLKAKHAEKDSEYNALDRVKAQLSDQYERLQSDNAELAVKDAPSESTLRVHRYFALPTTFWHVMVLLQR